MSLEEPHHLSPSAGDDTWPAVISETRLSNSFLGKLIEVCIVTADYRRTIEGLVRLGIGPWMVYTWTPRP